MKPGIVIVKAGVKPISKIVRAVTIEGEMVCVRHGLITVRVKVVVVVTN